MPHHLIKKIKLLLLVFLLSFTLIGCSSEDKYLRKDFIYDLLSETGYQISEDNYIDIACNLNIVSEDSNLGKENSYSYAYEVLTIYASNEDVDISDINLINNDDYLNKEESKKYIELLLDKINNKEFEEDYNFNFNNEVIIKDYKLEENLLITSQNLKAGDIFLVEEENTYKKVIEVLENDRYIVDDISYEDLEDYSFQDSFEINFDEAEFNELSMDDIIENYTSSYTPTSTKTLTEKGYKITYEFSKSSVNVRVSKEIKGLNFYYDLALNNIKPSVKWDKSNGTINEAYFKVSYKSTDLFGVSTGKYNNYVASFKDADTSSIKSLINSVLKKDSDQVEAIIPLCSFETPIPNVPLVKIGMQLVLKVYFSGKVELALYNNRNMGFEIINNNFRVINDTSRDIDLVSKASAKAVAGINFNASVINQRIMDFEVDGGIEAYLKTTMHLYENDGTTTSEEVDVSVDALETVTSSNNNVKVCGDLSLNWILELNINTSKSLLYKLGFHKTIEILNDDDQIFGNLSHIENGMFVEKCTRKSKLKSTTTTKSSLEVNKISLKRYSKVITLNNNYEIEISAIPSDYSKQDLRYSSDNSEVAYVSGGTIYAKSKGTCIVRVYTSDEKYEAFINILVNE